MTNSPMTNSLEMRWYPVTDDRGRTYMESRWIDVSLEQSATATAAHAA